MMMRVWSLDMLSVLEMPRGELWCQLQTSLGASICGPKKKKRKDGHVEGVLIVSQWVKNLTQCLWGCGFHPWPCCGVSCTCSSDPALLWLWHRLVAAALIRPLAWEPPYAAHVAVKRKKEKKRLSYADTGAQREYALRWQRLESCSCRLKKVKSCLQITRS